MPTEERLLIDLALSRAETDMMKNQALVWKARALRTEHIASLWKALAKRWHVSGWEGAEFNVLLYREQCKRKREAITRADTAEAERDALRCCGNCDRYAEDYESYKCNHPGPYEALIKTSSCPLPWHVCPEWKEREK